MFDKVFENSNEWLSGDEPIKCAMVESIRMTQMEIEWVEHW